MGSEMCIRDRLREMVGRASLTSPAMFAAAPARVTSMDVASPTTGCLLYTSDAADERSSVDLGGRRIIKKKKKEETPAHGAWRREIDKIRRLE